MKLIDVDETTLFHYRICKIIPLVSVHHLTYFGSFFEFVAMERFINSFPLKLRVSDLEREGYRREDETH